MNDKLQKIIPKKSNIKTWTIIILIIFVIAIIVYLFVAASEDTDSSNTDEGFSITSYILGGILILCIILIFYFSYDFQGSNLTLTMVVSGILISIFIFVIIYAARDTSEDNNGSSLKGYSVAVIILASLCIIAIIIFLVYKFSPSVDDELKMVEKEETDLNALNDSLEAELIEEKKKLDKYISERDKNVTINMSFIGINAKKEEIKKQIKTKRDEITIVKNKLNGIEEVDTSKFITRPFMSSLV